MNKQYISSISTKELKNILKAAEDEKLSNIKVYLDREQGFLVFGYHPKENNFASLEAIKVNKILLQELEKG